MIFQKDFERREEFVLSWTKVQDGFSGSLCVWVIMAGKDEMVGIQACSIIRYWTTPGSRSGRAIASTPKWLVLPVESFGLRSQGFLL